MMARGHILTGIAGGIGTVHLMDLSVPESIAGVVLCAGATLVPDLDHSKATITKTFGPITRLLGFLIRKISGGQRGGTHSIAGVAIIGAMAHLGIVYRDHLAGQIALIVLLCLALGGAIRMLRIPGLIDDLAPIPISIGLVCFTSVPLDVLPPALMLGCAIHIMGDMLTKDGCPLFWPLSRTRAKLGLFKTNGFVEKWIVTPVLIITILGLVAWKVFDTVSQYA